MNKTSYKLTGKIIGVSILSPLIVAGALWFFSKVENCIPTTEAQELVNSRVLDIKASLDGLDKRTDEKINKLEVRLDSRLNHMEGNMLTRIDKMETILIDVIIKEQKNK
jgi:hypothetical protein